MRLTGIRLHPFGKFADHQRDLSGPIVVIDEPNEWGKSTLRQAIVHACFTPTNLTPKKLADTMGPWYRQPGGDHCAVTLSFEHGGGAWTLHKRWGAGAAARLVGPEVELTGPAAVQERMAAILGHGEGTYRHVLVTGQAELEQTVERLRADDGALRDIADLARAGADTSGDVDEQRLRRALTERIAACFGRWDDDRERPQRQGGQERGVDNPWVNGCGTVVAAWYAWQTVAREHRTLVGLERELDATCANLAALEVDTARDRDFLAAGQPLRARLTERARLEEQQRRLTTSIEAMGPALKEWPFAAVRIGQWADRKATLDGQHKRLEAERTAARRRHDARGLMASFKSLEAARDDAAEATRKAAAHPRPDAAALAEIDRLDTAVAGADHKLAARTLDWRIDADAPLEASLERGSAPAEPLRLGPEGAQGTATARVRLRVGGATLTVESGGNVQELLDGRARDARARDEVLARCGFPTVGAAREAAAAHALLEAAAARKQAAYEALLAGKSFERWQEEIAALAELPQTRDVAAVDDEITANRSEAAAGDARNASDSAAVRRWEQAYGEYDALAGRLADERRSLAECQATLETLPEVPEGFAGVAAFVDALGDAQGRVDGSQTQRLCLATERGRLEGEIGQSRSEDLEERLAEAQRAFRRALEQGRAYRHIERTLEQVAASGSDPLARYGGRVMEIFSRVTLSPSEVTFDRTIPARVTRGNVVLVPGQLSQAGQGGLALAVRLAMAEAYTAGGGFAMLDDPFVHFDAGRMAEAAAILRDCAERFQILFFTCHAHHAERVRGGPA